MEAALKFKNDNTPEYLGMKPPQSASSPRILEASSHVVSLRDLAQKLHVAASTVSRALQNNPRISDNLRKRIKACARKAGYQPDPMLSALAHYRKGKTKTQVVAEIAWVNHWPEAQNLRRFHEYDHYWQGAFETAHRHGYRLQEYLWNNITFPIQRLETTLLARNTRGMLIPPHPDIPLDWEAFDWSPFCIVRFGHSIPQPQVHVVTSNQVVNSKIAFREIQSRGYERIGLVTSAKMIRNTRVLEGFLAAQFPISKIFKIAPLVFTNQEEESVNRHHLQSWLRQAKPDAVLTDVSPVCRWIEIAGYSVPKDIGIAVMSVLDGGGDAGIDQRPFEIGKAAAELVISRINNYERGIPSIPREVTIIGRWKDGASLPSRAVMVR
jgi:LacI family transcriptional regulator